MEYGVLWANRKAFSHYKMGFTRVFVHFLPSRFVLQPDWTSNTDWKRYGSRVRRIFQEYSMRDLELLYQFRVSLDIDLEFSLCFIVLPGQLHSKWKIGESRYWPYDVNNIWSGQLQLPDFIDETNTKKNNGVCIIDHTILTEHVRTINAFLPNDLNAAWINRVMIHTHAHTRHGSWSAQKGSSGRILIRSVLVC